MTESWMTKSKRPPGIQKTSEKSERDTNLIEFVGADFYSFARDNRPTAQKAQRKSGDERPALY